MKKTFQTKEYKKFFFGKMKFSADTKLLSFKKLKMFNNKYQISIHQKTLANLINEFNKKKV